jgi:hypothetical protein
MEKGTSETQEILREARRNLLREKRRAKCRWQLKFTEKCQKKNFQANPKEASNSWKASRNTTEKPTRNFS